MRFSALLLRFGAEVTLNVYRIKTPGWSLWDLAKEAAGAYHLGVAVGGVEFTFGTYGGRNSKEFLGAGCGIVHHEVGQPGEGFELKHSEPLGFTTMSPQEVARSMAKFYGKAHYLKLRRNCIDFSREFCSRLGVSPPPAWTYQALQMVRDLGLASEARRIWFSFAAVPRLSQAGEDEIRELEARRIKATSVFSLRSCGCCCVCI